MSPRNFVVPSPNTRLGARAWEIHRINGHPKGYKGPCWGPLPDEVEQARRELRGDTEDRAAKDDA